MATELVHVGFHNYVALDRVIVVFPADSSDGKRTIRYFKSRGTVVDMTAGRRAKAAIVVDRDHLILAAANPQVISELVAARRRGAPSEG